MMKMSIIIPVYNAESCLERAVASVMNQQGVDVEVILVEDYSTDASWQLCEALVAKYTSIKLFRTNGKGVSAARNTGLQYATGEIIGFCDADDFIEANALNIVKQKFLDQSIDILIAGYWTVRDNQTSLVKTKKNHWKEMRLTSLQAIEHILCDSHVMGSVWNKYYRADMLKDIFFDTDLSYNEDTHFNVRILKNNPEAKCLLIPNTVYNYVSNETSLTHDYSKMFDELNRSKYNVSLYEIEKLENLSPKEKRYIKRALYKISVVDVSNSCVDVEKRRLLYQEVKRNWIHFALNFYKFGFKHNTKLVLIGMAAILRGEPTG